MPARLVNMRGEAKNAMANTAGKYAKKAMASQRDDSVWSVVMMKRHSAAQRYSKNEK